MDTIELSRGISAAMCMLWRNQMSISIGSLRRRSLQSLSTLSSTLAILCVLAGFASAETPAQVASSGSWTLYRGEYAFAEEEGYVKLSPSCFAMTGNEKATMTFAALPRQMNERGGEFAGVIYLQIAVDGWNFRKHVASVKVGDGRFNMTIEGAFYDEEIIMVNMGGNGQPPAEFDVAAQTWAGKITVSDERSKALVSFPANGLKAIYPRLLNCAGLG